MAKRNPGVNAFCKMLLSSHPAESPPFSVLLIASVGVTILILLFVIYVVAVVVVITISIVVVVVVISVEIAVFDLGFLRL